MKSILSFLQALSFLLVAFLFFNSCQKIKYEQVDSPSYLRVFNAVWDRQSLDQEGEEAFLCMLIDPTFDAKGIPSGAQIIGDFLDKREGYASPYPTGIGTGKSTNNKDWPGSNVAIPVGPIVNGFDLSSWAQVTSGEHRVVFMYRPKNETSFFSLDLEHRSNVLIDTVINLQQGEVYTMQALTLDFGTKEKGIVLRKENFLNQPFAEDKVYVNFYNYSAKGYVEASDSQKGSAKDEAGRMFHQGVQDVMDVYLSLYTGWKWVPFNEENPQWGVRFMAKDEDPETMSGAIIPTGDSGYDRTYITTLKHNDFSSSAAPYTSFPLWSVADTTGKIYTDLWQRFFFLKPGLDIKNLPTNYGEGAGPNLNGNYAIMTCFKYKTPIRFDSGRYMGLTSGAAALPNLAVTIPSGSYTQRTFATINTIEVINGSVYLMTLQRKFEAPVY